MSLAAKVKAQQEAEASQAGAASEMVAIDHVERQAGGVGTSREVEYEEPYGEDPGAAIDRL
jgi:hypothetical protein